MLRQTDTTPAPFWRTDYPLAGKQAESLPDGEPAGLVLPHHAVANPMTARILSEAAERFAGDLPEAIILLGPNHKREGVSRIQTVNRDWETPEGVMPVAGDWASRLIRDFGASGDAALMEREHSVNTLVPWVCHFFPDASLLPILLHGSLEQDQCRDLSRYLADFAATRKTLVIASVDFSHGLKSSDALACDEKTWFLLKAGDTTGVLRLGNDHLDAPPTLATLMMTMEALKAGPAHLAGHAEASAFLGHPVEDTTSYLAVVFREAVTAP